MRAAHGILIGTQQQDQGDSMTTRTPLQPPYGLVGVVPVNALAAWGARLIVTQDGHVDFVPDRQGVEGGENIKQDLLRELSERFPLAELTELLSDLLRDGIMQTRTAEDFVLHMDDDGLIVVANTKGSAGYCYVTAWITCDDCSTLPGVALAMDTVEGIQACDSCSAYPGDLEAAAAAAHMVPGAVVKFDVGYGTDEDRAALSAWDGDAATYPFEAREWNGEDLPEGEFIAAGANPWVEVDGVPIDWTTYRLPRRPNDRRHWSDCALHNGPAFVPEPCSCGVDPGRLPDETTSEWPMEETAKVRVVYRPIVVMTPKPGGGWDVLIDWVDSLSKVEVDDVEQSNSTEAMEADTALGLWLATQPNFNRGIQRFDINIA